MAWYSITTIILLLGTVVVEAVFLLKRNEIIEGLQKEIDDLTVIQNRLNLLNVAELGNLLVYFKTTTERMQREYDHSWILTGAQLTRFEREIKRMHDYFTSSPLYNAKVRSREDQLAIDQNSTRIRELHDCIEQLQFSIQEGRLLQAKRKILAGVTTKVVKILAVTLALPVIHTDSDES